MSFSGMDVDAVLKQARTLEHDAANQLFNVITQMQGIIPQLADAWKGPDAERFIQQWEQHHRTLTLLHGTLVDVAGSVQTAIVKQQQASGH